MRVRTNHLTSGLGVLRRERSSILSQTEEKMMERLREIADPTITFSEGGDQIATRAEGVTRRW